MKTTTRNHIASAFVLGIFAFLAIGSGDTDSGTQKVQSNPEVASLSAADLAGEYKVNEVAADLKYKGKAVVVSGVIAKIGKSVLDEAFIKFDTPGYDVECYFTQGEEPAVAGLRVGAMVTVKGEVSGLTLGDVDIHKCRLQ